MNEFFLNLDSFMHFFSKSLVFSPKGIESCPEVKGHLKKEKINPMKMRMTDEESMGGGKGGGGKQKR